MDIEAMRREAEAPSIADEDDLDAVAADLADAFTDDVAFDWFLRDDDKRTSARLRFFRLIVRMGAASGGRIERPACGGAAAIWMPFEALGPLPLRDELRAFPVLLNATGLARFSRLLALRADMDKHHPMERPHAYLWFLGVTHAAQGHGVGSRLLKVATDRLDADARPAYLETQTERNLALYRRHGFEVISEHRPRPDGPMLWSMWRESALV
ncbi:MAG TPA: GNAT family N-acetyltransferase [Caulobacteraceae bacterium]|jgi:ribosomal protein S18 acetylase RimI-like enzyme|nr:GNAT family N-acetyltransferase [Caulobacteraceae bacterium]